MVRNAIIIALVASACGPRASDYPYVREAGCEQPCEPDGGRDAGPPGDAGPPQIPAEPLEDWDTTGSGPLTGLYAVEVRIPARAIVDLETRQIYRLRVLQNGTQVRTRITACRYALPSIPMVATLTIPARLEDVLHTITLEQMGDFLTAPDPIGATITTPRATILLGANLADPVSDPLPTADMLATALDQDGDSQPGVTIAAEVALCRHPGEIYVALRASVAMSAMVASTDRFEGTVDPTLEQSVLGVSDHCLNVAATLQIEILDGSTFIAQRVGDEQDLDGNGNVSCPEIGWFSSRLFGEFWTTVR